MKWPLVGALGIVLVAAVMTVLVVDPEEDLAARTEVHRVLVHVRPWTVTDFAVSEPFRSRREMREQTRRVPVRASARGFPIDVDTGGYCKGEPRPMLARVGVEATRRAATISVEVRKVRDYSTERMVIGGETSFGYVCDGIGTSETAWVRLDTALGNRRLRDGSVEPPATRNLPTIFAAADTAGPLRRSLLRGTASPSLRKALGIR